MKKLLLVNAALLIMSLFHALPLDAVIFTDINGTVIDLGKEGIVRGGGITVLWGMPLFFDEEKVLLYINSSFTGKPLNRDSASKNSRTYIPVSAGMEYRLQIYELPLYLTGSAGAGISWFKKEYPRASDTSKTHTDTDYGPYADLAAGFNLVLSQNLALFAKGGFQISFYNEQAIKSPAGYQFHSGLRIPLSGEFRSLGGVDEKWNDTGKINNILKSKRIKTEKRWEIYPALFMPTGKFAKMVNPGPGGLLSWNISSRNFTTGIEAGYLFIPGKESYKTEGLYINQVHIVPLAIKGGYIFSLFRQLTLTPSISLGGAFISTSFNKIENFTKKETLKTRNGADPMTSVSLSIDYSITDSFKMGIKAGYRRFIEEEISPQFISLGINLGMRF